MDLTQDTKTDAAGQLKALPKTLTGKDITRLYSFNHDIPLAPPEYRYKLERFGFPRPMQELAASLKRAISRIPMKDDKDRKLRDLFLSLIASKGTTSDDKFVQQVLTAIGENQATVDLLDKRINEMTSADLIVGKEYQTPDQNTVESLRAGLLKEDRERFARVDATPGASKLEWDVMEPDSDESPSPGW